VYSLLIRDIQWSEQWAGMTAGSVGEGFGKKDKEIRNMEERSDKFHIGGFSKMVWRLQEVLEGSNGSEKGRSRINRHVRLQRHETKVAGF